MLPQSWGGLARNWVDCVEGVPLLQREIPFLYLKVARLQFDRNWFARAFPAKRSSTLPDSDSFGFGLFWKPLNSLSMDICDLLSAIQGLMVLVRKCRLFVEGISIHWVHVIVNVHKVDAFAFSNCGLYLAIFGVYSFNLQSFRVHSVICLERPTCWVRPFSCSLFKWLDSAVYNLCHALGIHPLSVIFDLVEKVFPLSWRGLVSRAKAY